MSKYSEACCKIPPIIEKDYSPKGTYSDLNGTKTYITGPSSAKTGILVFFDVFGFFPQTIQGADILAYSNAERPARVFMPDFLAGNPAKVEWFPPDTEEKKAASGAWMKESLSPEKHVARFEEMLSAAAKESPDVTSWGAIGYCWGGKIVSLIGAKDTLIKAGIQSSPAMVSVDDAEKVKIPMMMLASKDEPVDDVKKFEEALTVTKHIETFGDQVHGWMSARADLSDSKVVTEYERGYKLAVEFFDKNL